MTNNMQMQVVPVVNQVAPMPIGPMVFGLGPAQIVCPYCGANLDPGEKCDCLREKENTNNDNSYIIKE